MSPQALIELATPRSAYLLLLFYFFFTYPFGHCGFTAEIFFCVLPCTHVIVTLFEVFFDFT
jgi:hypothetical protein